MKEVTNKVYKKEKFKYNMKKIENKIKDERGLFIPAGIFLGTGFGFLLGNLVAWIFIGLGLGFLSMIFYPYKKK